MKDCIAHQFGCGCETKCRARIDVPEPSYSRAPEYLLLTGIIFFAALGIWAGSVAMERVNHAYQVEARV